MNKIDRKVVVRFVLFLSIGMYISLHLRFIYTSKEKSLILKTDAFYFFNFGEKKI
jgi:hypothetical protein